jgi:hypothetical protein
VFFGVPRFSRTKGGESLSSFWFFSPNLVSTVCFGEKGGIEGWRLEKGSIVVVGQGHQATDQSKSHGSRRRRAQFNFSIQVLSGFHRWSTSYSFSSQIGVF